MKAKLWVMRPQAKECLEPLEAGRNKREFSPRISRGSKMSADILISSFWPSELRVVLLFQATWIVVIYYGRCRKLTYLLYLLFWILYIFWIFINICSHFVSLISNILVLRVLGSRILAAMWNIEVIVPLPSVWSGRKDETHKTINE